MESGRARLSRVTEQQARVLRSKQKLWDDLSREYALCRKKARQDETARERLRQEKQQLASSLADKNLRLEVALEEQRLRDIKISTCQREMADCSAAQLKLSAQMDGVRSQLGMAVRELTEQRERHQEAVAQVHALDKSNEQLKEEAATREKQAVQLERLLARSRTEAHGLRADAQRLEAAVKALRAQAAALAAEERRLNDLLREADAERTELRREAESRLDERDVIATMLVRRNDEVLLLREKGRLLQDALVRGRAALLAAREDSRLLALEVRRLRAERRHLAAQVQNTPGLRAQLYRALQDLTRDQVRLRALEDEMSCPLNVHRWRKLEGVDPPAFELLLKVRILQKRVLHLSAAGLRREAQLRHTEGLYVALRRAVCPTEGLPGPIGVPRHTRLASRGRHLKALIAEVSALEALADQKTATRLLADLRCSELHLPDLDLRKRKAPDEGREEPEEAPRAKQPSPRPAGNVVLPPAAPAPAPATAAATVPAPGPAPASPPTTTPARQIRLRSACFSCPPRSECFP
ncbi:cilia- and flagella-associated protein 58-like [Frankliniella occidentalis]|uniref:Cilia- and flagella-associated protein 58-like n=1 Tax=Frankliniella occidentalis TaxID=133901 RepID=A0A9C6XCB7_FRAOC|nr:cilia- and flagella-associated protein 58-like [Frankliniella occidentalis]